MRITSVALLVVRLAQLVRLARLARKARKAPPAPPARKVMLAQSARLAVPLARKASVGRPAERGRRASAA